MLFWTTSKYLKLKSSPIAVLFFLIVLSSLNAATPGIQKLKDQIPACQSDTCTSRLSLMIATRSLSDDLDTTLFYCKQAQKYSDNNINRDFQIQIIEVIALQRKRHFSKVDSLFALLSTRVENVNQELQTSYYGNASSFYVRQERFDEALHYAQLSLDVIDTTNFDFYNSVHGNIVVIHKNMNHYGKALDKIYNLIEYVKKNAPNDQQMNRRLCNLFLSEAQIFARVRDYKSAESAYQQALGFKSVKPKTRIKVLSNYSNFCYKQSRFDSLEKYLKQLDVLTPIMSLSTIKLYKDLTIDNHVHHGRLELAMDYNEMFKQFLIGNNFQNNLYLYFLNRAEIHLRQNQFQSANVFFEKALVALKQEDYSENELYHQALSKFILTLPELLPKNRLQVEQYARLRDTLEIRLVEEQLQYAKEQFDSERLEGENNLLQTLNKLSQAKIAKQNTIFSGLLSGTILTLLFLYLLFRRYRKERYLTNQLALNNDRLQLAQREMKHRSHGYLKTAINMLTEQRRSSDTEELDKALLKTEKRIRALSSVSAALDRKNLNSKKLDKLITDLIEDLTYKTEKPINKNISIADTQLDNHQIISLALITNELVFNSLKYAFDETTTPEISLSIASKNNQIHYNYNDNGSGMDGTIKGTGEGRQLIADFVTQVHGKASESNVGGYNFNFVFDKALSYA